MKFPDFKAAYLDKKIDKKSLFARLKNDLSFLDLQKFVQRFKKELPAHKNLLLRMLAGPHDLPKEFEKVNRNLLLYNTQSLEHELGWQAIGFIEQEILINKFIRLRIEFEKNLLAGKYSDAREILDTIDSSICLSTWGAENRLILDEYQYGSKENWVTRNLFVDEKNENDFKIAGHFNSIRCESKISFTKFKDHYATWEAQSAEFFTQHQDAREYYRFKLNYLSNESNEHYDYLIYRGSQGPLIDRYIMFMRVVQQLTVSSNVSPVYIVPILQGLKLAIQDGSLETIIAVLVDNQDIKSTDQLVIDVIDKYTLGDYENARTDLADLIKTGYASEIDLLLLYSKCLIERGIEYIPIIENECLLNIISRLFHEILTKGPDSDRSYVELIKISYVFSNSHIGITCYSFVKEQLGWKTFVDFSYLSGLSTRILNPSLTQSLFKTPKYLGNYLDNLQVCYPDSITVKLFQVLYGRSSDRSLLDIIPAVKSKVYSARTYIQNEEFKSAIEVYKQLVVKTDLSVIIRHEIMSNLYLSYLSIKDYHNCLKVFVTAFLDKAHLAKKMDYDSVLYAIIESKFKNIEISRELIELPIFFAITCKDPLRIKQAYEKFLIANNCSIPSDLLLGCNHVSKENLIYFLSKVCVPEIMMLSRYLSSTYDVNVERIKICQYLATIDLSNISIYNTEIASITQKNAISKVIGRIDEGKIYVNDEKLKQTFLTPTNRSEVVKLNASPSAKQLSKEFFIRTIELQKFTKTNEYKQFNIHATYDSNGKLNVVVQPSPTFNAFKDMFLEIRDNFVADNEYGLNPYLSTRIRHGTLPNHIRSVFERLQLVTVQTDGVYGENEHWKEKLTLDENTNKKVQELLSTFSAKVDEISSMLKDEWIQYKTERKNDKPDAYFDYTYSEDAALKILYRAEFDTYEGFIEFCFDELWARTENCLEKIRFVLNNDIKTRFTTLLTDLEQKLDEIPKNFESYGLKNNVNLARTEIQTLLSNIAKWFQRSESSYDGEYELAMLAETSIQITKNINPNYNFEIKHSIDENIFIKGEFHQHMIDAIRNFLENMIKRSKLSIDGLKPEFSITERNGRVEMNFANNISDGVPIVELNNKLSKIKTNWHLRDMNVSQEDGTGFPKIKKILHSDMERKESLFDYELADNRLILNVSFENNGLKI